MFRDLRWFVVSSWSYLGCDSGTGRWKARRKYFAKLIPSARKYLLMGKYNRA